LRIEIKVPAIGESIIEATVSRIIKPSGSVVRADEEILELETDKVNQVLYATQGGELTLSVKVGDTVKIDQVIGQINTDVTAPAAPAKVAAPPLPLPKPAPIEAPGKRKKMSALRRTIASRLVDVKNKTAMLTTFNEVDMTKVMEIRAKEKETFQQQHGVKLGLMSFFVKATALALKAYPDVASYIEGDEIVYFPNDDIGVAVSTDKGLMVPVIRRCLTASLADIEKQVEAYAKKARDGLISLDDLKGGCFTITNGGVFGSLLSTPIINPPQSAILGMHTIQKRPIALNDQVVIRPMMYLAVSYDHRVIDGKEAVEFLVHIKKSLEEPSGLGELAKMSSFAAKKLD
jgi:2-oxoglutarate dehydrogenase E2 component (dihydrolipoamide succinyltransferase)